MDKCLIIARYNENLEWLKKHKDFKITVYNKGGDLSDNNFFKVINLENIGRESHTWLYHIVNNYNHLNEINIFLQGKIDDLNCMVYKNPNDYLKRINKYGFSVSRFGLLGPLHWDWNVNIDKDIRYKKKWENNEISRSNIGFRNFSKKLFPEIPLFVATSYSGCFAVKKEAIQMNDLHFYQKLLDVLSQNKNPIEGHYMERLWCYIFTRNRPLIESFFDVFKTKIERFKIW
ncbi:MAG: DUF3431 domain-containing protein [Prochlorococcus marinus CUG1437]|nr:DUF3431 domain-containing protein [Prochlorococcus marinus CUG1437]